MQPLPRIMVAPNGARRGKADHPALPVSDDEIADAVRACRMAGADGIHLHIRDGQGQHLLDAARYRALLARLQVQEPGLYLQVTSESAGRYGAVEQRAMMRELGVGKVSVALREMVRGPQDWPEAAAFYSWAATTGVEVQHILYSAADAVMFSDAVAQGRIPGRDAAVILVLGSYEGAPSRPEDVATRLAQIALPAGVRLDWMVCAFGASETDCLARAVRLGGKLRVGFENSLWHADGRVAADNADRVREVVRAIGG